jgi:rhodanese-related sulfurtransferase
MNKKIILISFFVFSVIFVIIYFSYFKKNKNFNKNINENSEKLLIINVLDKELYEDSHIFGSVQCDIDNLDNFLKNISKRAVLIFYCANYLCKSSFEAAKMAKELGYENVFAYEGGIAEWYQRGKSNDEFRVSGPCKMQYLEVIALKKNIDSKNKDLYVEKNDAVVNIISADDLLKMIKNNNI